MNELSALDSTSRDVDSLDSLGSLCSLVRDAGAVGVAILDELVGAAGGTCTRS